MWRQILGLTLSGFVTLAVGCSNDPDGSSDESNPPGGEDAAMLDAGGDALSEDDASSDDADRDGTLDETDHDAGSTDTEPPEPDTTDAGSDGGDDAGGGNPDCVEGRDSDSDGLEDCDEIRMCTDPNDGDTDDDGLGDFEEIQNQTDPCKADTDSDGVPDDEEIDLGLDPNRASSYEHPEKRDRNRWFVGHCDEPDPESVAYHTNYEGNWTLALPPTFDHKRLEPNLSGQRSAAVYDDPALNVAGALFSIDAPSGQTSPLDPLDTNTGSIHNAIDGMTDIDDNLLSAEFTTHNNKPAASMEYVLSVPQDRSPRGVRDDLLVELAPFERSEVDLPNSAGTQYTEYRVIVTVMFRKHLNNDTTNLIALGVAPMDEYESDDKVEFRLDDLTNTTNIADSKDTHRSTCLLQKPPTEKPKAEFYWVLDQSGSMSQENSLVRSFSGEFAATLQNTQLDFRLGVTNMVPENHGRLYFGPGWHTAATTFSGEVEDRVIDCTGGGWNCDTVDEYGLQVATEGINHMWSPSASANEAFRSSSDVYTIFMTDEGTKSNESWETDDLRNQTTAFALTPHDEDLAANNPDCAIGGPEPTGNYQDVALATGGQWADLCSGDNSLTLFLEEIIKTANRESSPFNVGQTPISVSMRVFLDGDWVPRSTEDGFDYSQSSNTVAFFGNRRPTFDPPPDTQPDWFSLNFETFNSRCKDAISDENANTCEPADPEGDDSDAQ